MGACQYHKLMTLWTTFHAGVVGGVGKLIGHRSQGTEMYDEFVGHVREYFEGNSTKKMEQVLWFCHNMCTPNVTTSDGRGMCMSPEMDKRFEGLAENATKLLGSKEEERLTPPAQIDYEELEQDDEDELEEIFGHDADDLSDNST